MIHKPSNVYDVSRKIIESGIAFWIAGDSRTPIPDDVSLSLFWVEVDEQSGTVKIIVQSPPHNHVQKYVVDKGRIILPHGATTLSPQQQEMITRQAVEWQGQFTAIT